MCVLGRQRSYLYQLLILFCIPAALGSSIATPVLTNITTSTSAVVSETTKTLFSVATASSNYVSSSIATQTTQAPKLTETKFGIELLNKEWSKDLLNMNSNESKELFNELAKCINDTLRKGNIIIHNVTVLRFRKGSVIAEVIIATTNSTFIVKETLRAQIKKEILGSFKVIPFLLMGKVFAIPVKLKNSASEEALAGNISALLNDTLRLETNVIVNGTEAAVTVAFNKSVSLYPKKTLSKLLKKIQTGYIGNISVEKKTNPYIKYPSLTTKDFEISFDLHKDCSKTSGPYKDLAKAILESWLEEIPQFVKVQSVSNAFCTAGLLDGTAIAEFAPSASDDPNSLLSPFYCEGESNGPNVTAMLLTPTTPKPNPKTEKHCTPRPATIPTTRRTTATTQAQPTTKEQVTPPKIPKLFIRMKFDLTWKEFCMLDGSLKQKFAANLFDKNENNVPEKQIKFINRDKNCGEPAQQDVKPVDLWWYVADKSQKTPDKCLTLKAMRVMKSLLDNGNTRQLGALFSSKVISVELAGCAAPKGSKPLDKTTLIIIIIGAILGLLLLLLACCCLCCGGRRRKRQRKYYQKGDHLEMLAVVNGIPDKDRRNRKKRRGKAVESDGDGEELNRNEKRNRNVKDDGIRARHGGHKHSTDYDNEYFDVSDDGCCGGVLRNSRAKRRGKGTDGQKNGKRKRGKEDLNKNRPAKDDEFGEVNEAMMGSEEEKKKENQGDQQGVTDKGNEQQRNANDYETITDQKLNSGRKGHDDGDSSDRMTQNTANESLIGTSAAGVTAGAVIASATASKGSPNASARGRTEGLNQHSISPPGSSGYTEKVPGTNELQESPIGPSRGSHNLALDRGQNSPTGVGRGSAKLSPNNINTSFGARRGSGATTPDGSKNSPSWVRKRSGNLSPDDVKDSPPWARRGSGNQSPTGLKDNSSGVRRGSGNLFPDSPSSARRGSGNLSPYGDNESPSGVRRGSANLSPDKGSFNVVRPPTPAVLRHVDDKADTSRRRSSAFGLSDEGSSPLTHKTATVGIVALALRNKNEKKKEAEFKNLDAEMPEPHYYPPATAVKNRNPDVLPSPATNVKLSKNPDYINANLVRDHRGKKRYVVTQHPLRDTITDFWQMVWDQQAKLIVMVNDEEHLQPDDYVPYWPTKEGESLNCGPFDITTKQVDKQADYVRTVLHLRDTVSRKGAAPLEITHFRFTSWKARDQMPNVGLFVAFMTTVRAVSKVQEETNPTKPIVVHCSDGQGYTGVYVAVDIGIRSHEESSNSIVDVFEMAKKLRRDRQGIICSLEHYNFTYQCLYEYTVNIQS